MPRVLKHTLHFGFMFQLTDKIAVVTGAASGIGEAIARALSGAGARVYVLDRDEATGRRIAGEISGEFLAADVSDEANCRACAEAILGKHGRCDILINN